MQIKQIVVNLVCVIYMHIDCSNRRKECIFYIFVLRLLLMCYYLLLAFGVLAGIKLCQLKSNRGWMLSGA